MAVRLGPDFKGLEVRSVSFIAEEDADVAGFSVWMSERLQLGSGKTNVPDVVSLPAEVKDGEFRFLFRLPTSSATAGSI